MVKFRLHLSLIVLLALPCVSQAQFLKLKDKEKQSASTPDVSAADKPATPVSKPVVTMPELSPTSQPQAEPAKPEISVVKTDAKDPAPPEPVEAAKPAVTDDDSVGPAVMTTTNEKGSTSTKSGTDALATPESTPASDAKTKGKVTGSPKNDAESGEAVTAANHTHDQEGCLGICKKYQEICSNDTIYDEKDCREQWNACEAGCLQL